jgi:hypothetical protein
VSSGTDFSSASTLQQLTWHIPVWPTLAYDSLSSKDVTEVEYATEWYLESQDRLLLPQATKKRFSYQVEADMTEMPSIS